MSSADASAALFETRLNLPGRRQGKVRDVYVLPGSAPANAAGERADDRLLIIASDRISAFDVVMPTPIAGKGRLLTQLSTFWLRLIETRKLARTHLISTDASLIPDSAFGAGTSPREALVGRVMICRRCRVIPIECVARGYLEGSGWKEYQATGSICGVRLPPGLKQCDKLPEPIFTPATKEEQGKHDENITFERACELVGEGLMRSLRDKTLAIYNAAADHASKRGIIIADTKFEFGFDMSNAGGSATEPIVIDEALTPDSSRFWPAAGYTPGRAQKSFDKQFLREYLETLVAAGSWNKQAPGPALPESVIEMTRQKYADAKDFLSGGCK
jgi:phosphoribosylaminoimidazole-succinocarboxamide synthase